MGASGKARSYLGKGQSLHVPLRMPYRFIAPAETRRKQHGERASTVVVGMERVLYRGRWRSVEVLACPVTWRPHPEQIARRAYEDWWQALVWSKAPVIIGAHDTGPLIRTKDGFWLAIPRPAAGKSSRGGRISPGERERRHGLRLRFVYRRCGPSLLVAEGRLK